MLKSKPTQLQKNYRSEKIFTPEFYELNML